jgi:hypothetical protein
MPCHAMHLMQDYFWKDFYMPDKFDMQPIYTSMLTKFYSCKKRVLQTYPPLRNLALEIQEALRNNSGESVLSSSLCSQVASSFVW